MRYNRKLLQVFKNLRQKTYEQFSTFHHLESLPGPNVIVLSPHPDDDVFGCGGAILRHVEQGHNVTIIYLCQGDKGIPNTPGQEAAAIRKIESQNAANILGVETNKLIYLEEKDNELHVNKSTIRKVNDIISSINPDIVYLPTFTDNHPDHFAANLILKQNDIKNTLIAGYEIWTPHMPNRIIDITSQISQKKLAIQAHKSQISQLDYLSAITGLNQYRGAMYPKQNFEYAESFLMIEKEEYCGLW